MGQDPRLIGENKRPANFMKGGPNKPDGSVAGPAARGAVKPIVFEYPRYGVGDVAELAVLGKQEQRQAVNVRQGQQQAWQV